MTRPIRALPPVHPDSANQSAATSRFSRRFVLTVLVLLAITVVFGSLIMFYDIPGSFQFAMRRRGYTMGAIVLVAVAIGVSTVMFQTVAGNRILTPSLMGLESLLLAVQTAVVFIGGTGGLVIFTGVKSFFVQVAIMVGFALALLWFALGNARRNLQNFLLIGVVLGILFRSLTVFVQRMVSPNQFDALQSLAFGNITNVVRSVFPWAALLIVVGALAAWRQRHVLDIIAASREVAIGVGVPYLRSVWVALALVAVMVASSVALVGPMLFFGFLVVTITYQLSDVDDHLHNFVLAVAVGLAMLSVAQFVLSEFFTRAAISIVLDMIGGAVFLLILFRRKAL